MDVGGEIQVLIPDLKESASSMPGSKSRYNN